MPNTALPTLADLENATEFQARHLGPWDAEQANMLMVFLSLAFFYLFFQLFLFLFSYIIFKCLPISVMKKIELISEKFE